MLKAATVIALIPARGGSRGVTRKNLADCAGRPLIYYTIAAATHSKYVDAVYVSSDDAEILARAEEYAVRALKRPAEFATDEASPTSVVEHALSCLASNGVGDDTLLVYLQPTSPLRTAAHIDAALELMVAQGAESVTAVREVSVSPYKCFRVDTQSRLVAIFDERLSNARRQDLPRTVTPNGSLYAFSVGEYKRRQGFPTSGGVAYEMDEDASIDIDTPSDLKTASEILRKVNG